MSEKASILTHLKGFAFFQCLGFQVDIEKLQTLSASWLNFADSILANGQSRAKKLSQNVKEGVILNLFQDLIRVVAFIGRFRNKFGMTQGCFEIVSKYRHGGSWVLALRET